jgi:NAD(P)H-dependent FMN reductase
MKFLVIYGSVRTARQGIAAARFATGQLEQRGHQVTLFDPLELELPLLDKMYKEYDKGQAPPPLERMAKAIRSAEGVVLVTGEYNHTVPPALLNLLDHFLEEWSWRPSAIVSYSAGSFGGVRAVEHLRSVVAELGMPAIPSSVPIPRIHSAFAKDGAPKDERLSKSFDRFAGELEWYSEALAARRSMGTPY